MSCPKEVEAPIEWFNEWVYEVEGEHGHYLEPTYISFKRSPNDSEMNNVETIVIEELEEVINRPSEELDSKEDFCIRIIEYMDPGASEGFLHLIEQLHKVVPIRIIACGVIVNL